MWNYSVATDLMAQIVLLAEFLDEIVVGGCLPPTIEDVMKRQEIGVT